MKGFTEFLKSQGVVGLAVGFIFGSQISALITSLVNNIINPLLGVILGFTGSLNEEYLAVGGAKVMWGSFVNSTINFLIIAFLVYFVVTGFGLDNKKK